ncbi:MAG: DUF1080 domain-containing protein, partial [Isosphaeraceae bacterium]|nr:DUF1080 domain-containing protein [Isosphaeraceae bacterium]
EMRRLPTRALLLIGLTGACLLAARIAPAAEEDEAGFVPLFDGKTLEGWKKVGGGATYRVEDGCIVGEVGPGPNTFLRTEKTYGDFILKLDAKLDVPGNSGIQFRSHQREAPDGNGRVFGYQCEIDPSDRAWTAGIYDEARRGWLYPLAGHPEAQKAFHKDDWNHFVIEARGPHLRTWLNGVPCADLLDPMDLEGFIALQVHAGKQGRIRWKNIRLKDLGRSHWKPLWDGQSLDGWEKSGGGDWAIEAGAIHGTNSSNQPRHGHLMTKDRFGDFAVRLKFQISRGNSGLYFRAEPGGQEGIEGLQADIDGQRKDTGGLYDIGGRGWLARPKPEDLKKGLKANDWNELSVIALGDRIVVHLNGQKTAEITDPQGRKRGKIALQLHGGQDVDVRFKDIDILRINGN